jgi:ABC-2 type transport system permease protein
LPGFYSDFYSNEWIVHPIESMPNWAQQVTLFNPIRYFVEIIRMVMLKGATFSDISRPFL